VTVFAGRPRSLWDEVWDEYDARMAARGLRPASPFAATLPHAAVPPAAHPAAAPPRRPARFLPWPRGWGLRRATLALVALTGLYLTSPIASAVQFAAAVQRADPATLAERVDWTLLRPGIEARLSEITRARLAGSPPAFLLGMQSALADRLSSPEGLAALLAHHLPAEGAASFGQALRQARPLSPGMWQVTLASPQAPQQMVRLTLRLTDPWSLRWAVVGVELPGPLGPPP